MKYYPFGGARSGSVPTDKLFTGQRLDDTGLYYYGARYYDAGIGRFISADTIIPNPANPQAFNRYSYCLNNPLKYVDPSGHIVTTGGEDMGAFYDAVESHNWVWLFQHGLPEMVASPEFQVWDGFRSIDKTMATALEKAQETVTIVLGEPANGWAAEYNRETNTITLDKDNNNLYSHKSILDFSHEARHAWQDVVASKLANTTFDQMKWYDVVYCEWDAYKYQADLDDRLGWGTYSGWRRVLNQQKFFQALDLENSWHDYQKAFHRFVLHHWERVCWWKIYSPEGIRTLTEDLYVNR
jgi:RHS repeat-associated protein